MSATHFCGTAFASELKQSQALSGRANQSGDAALLHAMHRRKFRSDRDNSGACVSYRDVEDHLTAAVLARLSYLSRHTAETILQHATEARSPASVAIPPTLNDTTDHVSLEFWPRYPLVLGEERVTVEPDALLRVGDHVCIVEAKRLDAAGQTADQLANEWLAWKAADESAGVASSSLLLIGGVDSLDHFARLVSGVNARLRDVTHAVFDPPPMAWISWSKLSRIARQQLAVATPVEARILRDLALALSLHGYGTFVSLQDVAHAWRAMMPLQTSALRDAWPASPRIDVPRHGTAYVTLQRWSEDVAALDLRPLRSNAWPHVSLRSGNSDVHQR